MNFKTINLVFILLLANVSFSQKEKVDTTKQVEQSSFAYNAQKAIKDIKSGLIEIILPGGLVAASELPGDAAFEKKYGVSFFSQGCVRFPGDNASAYNEEVFKYLDKKYGKIWRDEIRTDAVGFKGTAQ